MPEYGFSLTYIFFKIRFRENPYFGIFFISDFFATKYYVWLTGHHKLSVGADIQPLLVNDVIPCAVRGSVHAETASMYLTSSHSGCYKKNKSI